MIEPERILYEDNHLIVLNKKTSELVQGDKTGDRTLADEVRDFIKLRDSKPGNVFLGVCHRLDRPTSGVVVFAKTGKALSRMNTLFRDNEVAKIYWAVTESAPSGEEGTFINYLKKHQAKNKSFVVEDPGGDAKKAELDYRVVAASKRYYLLEVRPKTGRHHQIRAQLAAAGAPIKGDLKYGARRSDPGGGIHLHARTIEFIHPVSKAEINITAPVPEETLWKVLEREARLTPRQM